LNVPTDLLAAWQNKNFRTVKNLAMTIRVPQENIFDKILKKLGKKRRIILPENIDKIYEKYGPYTQICAKKERFIKALLRTKTSKAKGYK
jgi:hypothetical protein